MSVASFFVSRIDALVDSIAESKLKSASSPAERALLGRIVGNVAIANAKVTYLTYQRYEQICSTDRWRALKAKGAQKRLLWPSTSTKSPKYRDVLYVEELVGPDTVNTIPMPTQEAFRDHGGVRLSLEKKLEEAADTMQMLPQVGISMKDVTGNLLRRCHPTFCRLKSLLNSLDRMCELI